MAIKKIEHHDHHHWHLDYTIKELFIGLLILVVILTMVRIVETKATESNTMYEACLDACVEKPFGWASTIPDDFKFNYDRTECIRVCNSMLRQASGASSAAGSLRNDCRK